MQSETQDGTEPSINAVVDPLEDATQVDIGQARPCAVKPCQRVRSRVDRAQAVGSFENPDEGTGALRQSIPSKMQPSTRPFSLTPFSAQPFWPHHCRRDPSHRDSSDRDPSCRDEAGYQDSGVGPIRSTRTGAYSHVDPRLSSARAQDSYSHEVCEVCETGTHTAQSQWDWPSRHDSSTGSASTPDDQPSSVSTPDSQPMCSCDFDSAQEEALPYVNAGMIAQQVPLEAQPAILPCEPYDVVHAAHGAHSLATFPSNIIDAQQLQGRVKVSLYSHEVCEVWDTGTHTAQPQWDWSSVHNSSRSGALNPDSQPMRCCDFDSAQEEALPYVNAGMIAQQVPLEAQPTRMHGVQKKWKRKVNISHEICQVCAACALRGLASNACGRWVHVCACGRHVELHWHSMSVVRVSHSAHRTRCTWTYKCGSSFC